MTGEEMFAELLRTSAVQPADLLDPKDPQPSDIQQRLPDSKKSLNRKHQP